MFPFCFGAKWISFGTKQIEFCQRELSPFGLEESTIDSEGFKGGTRGAPIMPRDAVSRTANVIGA